MSAASLIAMVVGKNDLLDGLDAQVGKDVGDGGIAAVEKQRGVARAEDTDVDGTLVEMKVLRDLDGLGGTSGGGEEEEG